MISKQTLSSLKRDIVVLWFQLLKKQTYQLNGVDIHLDRALMSRQVIDAILRKTYEQPEYNSIKKNLSKSDVVLEMGTGIGYISLQCARIVGEKNVYTFEPSPTTAELALKNFELNNARINLSQKVLGPEKGKSTFYSCHNFESSSLSKRDGVAREIEVECEDVNEVMKEIRPTFLVMDIEGGEAELIPKTNLSDIKKISMEIHPHVIGDDAVNSTVLHILNEGFVIDWASSAKKVLFFYRPEKH